MSRRSNYWDNAVAESFFSSIKRKLIERQIYPTRAQAKSENFEYIEEFTTEENPMGKKDETTQVPIPIRCNSFHTASNA
jgi:transposase InsO family protein